MAVFLILRARPGKFGLPQEEKSEMTRPKLLLVALFAAAGFVFPAMAQEFYAGSAPGTTYAAPPGAAYAAQSDAAYVTGPAYVGGYRAYRYGCAPAPRVGAFASQPWENDVPCY
jgi:hypothetical protein